MPEGFTSAVGCRATKGPLRGPGPTPLRCSVSGPVAETHSAPFVRSVQTVGDKSVHEALCERGPRALRSSAPKRRPPTCPNAPLRQSRFSSDKEQRAVQRAAGGIRRGRFLGRRGAQGLRPRAQRVREPTCRRLFERSARRARSEFRRRAARPSTAAQSAVPSRPPQHEPPPDTARREPPNLDLIHQRTPPPHATDAHHQRTPPQRGPLKSISSPHRR